MRVTERSRVTNMVLAQNRASNRFENAARVASSGQRVSKPSDDPVAYGAKVRRDHDLAMLDERSKIATRAEGELDVAASSLSTASDILVSVQEAAVAGANVTTDGNARKLLAQDVRTMRDELMSIANTRYGDRYIFGGTKTAQPPFDTTTSAFNGNDQIVRVPVLDGVNPPANVSGARTFTAVGGRDIFADLDALANALDANDQTAIKNAISPLTDAHAQVVRSQVEAGFGAERFRNALDVIANTRTAVTGRQSNEIEGDPTAQITELTLARTAYERSVAVTKQLLSIGSGG